MFVVHSVLKSAESYGRSVMVLKCPVCGGKLDFNLKAKSACCHACGWENRLFSKKATHY